MKPVSATTDFLSRAEIFCVVCGLYVCGCVCVCLWINFVVLVYNIYALCCVVLCSVGHLPLSDIDLYSNGWRTQGRQRFAVIPTISSIVTNFVGLRDPI